MSEKEGTRGRVYLAGAGPGDPRLLTLRAAECIATADLIAVDALVSSQITAMFPRTTEVVFVGKRASAHSLPQEEINALLIAEARKGKSVLRLKGGDPFVFGRGGEEAQELMAAGIAVEIVPGISSAIAGPAYAGIPVTHRSFATSVTLDTAHESEGSTGIPWPALAQLDGTIVFMMGFANLGAIVRNLTDQGVPRSRPVAVISKATTPEQRTIRGTLHDIEELVTAASLATPALIVVGEVVQMHDVINWFETRPLFGKRIVVTRARQQASDLRRLFEDSGAAVVEFPTIEIGPPSSYVALDRSIDETWDWLIFTSANGVHSFFDRLFSKGKDVRSLSASRVAAVGEPTAAALRSHGLIADLVPEKFLSSALLPLLARDQKGIRTAVVRAAEGRDELIEELRSRGGDVLLAVAYETRAVVADPAALQDIDVVTFTSASTVDNYFSMVAKNEASVPLAVFASIGPVTSDAIKRHDRMPEIEAPQATVQSLHDAVVAHFGSLSGKR
ncbi:MAG: uroporphyrinogen-III C-methyltransferase [Thermoanaerobaculia bacterium]